MRTDKLNLCDATSSGSKDKLGDVTAWASECETEREMQQQHPSTKTKQESISLRMNELPVLLY